MSQIEPEYIHILNSLREKIRLARIKATIAVNVELLKLYWEIGNTILKLQKEEGWGAKIIDKLAIDLKMEFSDFKGLSVRNLKYMRAFAKAYPAIVQPAVAQLDSSLSMAFVQPLVAQIPWTHHTIILDKVKTSAERLFYVEKTMQNGWSKSILSLQIDSNLYKRQGNAITNFDKRLPAPLSDLANETLKNPYIFDFLGYSEELKERELEKALMQHLKKFMLELGRGFAFVGNQKNINVQGDDYFLDMLFYNYHLHCFVVFELKVGNFKPEFAGKLNFYVNTVNEQIKSLEDKPTIGVLLCKTPNETVIKYALKGIESPIGVADYELSQALPKQLKGEIPSIEELEAEIEKEYKELITA
jgi:predicted nuclease of restriction endonuclease-like (RecB) superfamily